MNNDKPDSNIILIGDKPFMNYVKSIVIQFKALNREEVVVKARGKYTNKAIDLAEFVRKKILADRNLEIKNVRIDSEEKENKEGKMVNVSMIEITLGRKESF